MKPQTSEHFNYRPWLAAAVSAAFLVPLAFVGAPALAKSAASASQYQYGGSHDQYKGKVTICHFTHSKKHPWHEITVGAPAAKAHLRHHDTLGPCPTTTTSGDNHHGKGGDKGKGGDQGDDDQGNGKSDQHGNGGDHGKSGDHGHGK